MQENASFLPIPLNQAWHGRRETMQMLMKYAFKHPINVLEIGVWFGLGSTQIWLDNLKPQSNLLLLDSWRPYASQSDLSNMQWDYKSSDNMSTDAFLSTFLNVKKFENEYRDRQISIQMTRGRSKDFLPFLRDDSFDFIYIDGDHRYADSKFDIIQAKRLIKKDFGIICGDDLELLPTNALIEIAKNNTDTDFVKEPQAFHPGVLLAVSEEFDHVNMVNGFWWVICKNGEFNTCSIEFEMQFMDNPMADVRLLEQDVNGYNIVMLDTIFLGVPISLGELNLRKKEDLARPGIIVKLSLQELKTEIARITA